MHTEIGGVSYDLHLHHDDHLLDEVMLVAEQSSALRLKTLYRYKVSDISGDEWRTSTMWQAFGLPLQGDHEPDRHEPDWLSFDGGWSGKLEVGCAALYPGLYSSQPQLHHVPVLRIEFRRKGRTLYTSSYDGAARPLLTVAGHLSWALISAQDQGLGTNGMWQDHAQLCHQAGCAEPAVSTYRIKNLYDKWGDPRPAVQQHPKGERGLVHRFCRLHLRRGDCGLEDADRNYEVIQGPGPEV